MKLSLFEYVYIILAIYNKKCSYIVVKCFEIYMERKSSSSTRLEIK
jgi:hypothetical protein